MLSVQIDCTIMLKRVQSRTRNSDFQEESALDDNYAKKKGIIEGYIRDGRS